MIYVEIQGTRVPALGLGTWRLWDRECREAVTSALSIGYRHVDTAQMYQNEEEVGRGVRDAGLERESLFITTKIAESNLAAENVRRSFEGSLRNLNMPYVDLLLIHWPDPSVPLEETLDAMLQIKEEGKARHIGVSNFTPDLFERAAAHAPIFCNQVEYHPFLSQERLIELARGRDAMLTAYSPIARGHVEDSDVLRELGERHSKSPAQIALRWIVQQENVAAIPKSSSRKHQQSNFEIFDFALSPEEMDQIGSLARDERLVNPVTAPWNQ